jgi:uncharacterized protein YfaS (alpha-2-macroglobulin family)
VGRRPEPFDEKFLELGTTVTDGDGHAILSVGDHRSRRHRPAAGGGGDRLGVRARRPSGARGAGAEGARQAVYYGVKVDQGDAGKGDPPVSLDIIAVNAAGPRVGATATYTLISENWDYDWFQQDGRWQWRRTSRDAVVAKARSISAPASPRASPAAWAGATIAWWSRAPDGAKTVTRFSPGWGSPAKEGEAPDFVRVSAGTKAYAARRHGRDHPEVALCRPGPGGGRHRPADRLQDRVRSARTAPPCA